MIDLMEEISQQRALSRKIFKHGQSIKKALYNISKYG